MDDETHLGQMGDAPEMIFGRYAVGRARLDDRTGEIQQRWRDRHLKGVGQIGFVVSCFIDQSQ